MVLLARLVLVQLVEKPVFYISTSNPFIFSKALEGFQYFDVLSTCWMNVQVSLSKLLLKSL